MKFSIVIPLGFHRQSALDCVRGWVSKQDLPGEEFELVCLLPAADPDGLRGPIQALLRPHDQLILCEPAHDMALCALGAAQARGEFLFFTESHVWPEADVLQASMAAFREHPDWAAFSCRTLPVAPNRLARMEADMYERDIDQAMNHHPWRKILDQCFVTRRAAYAEAGGIDAALGHYAEWVLAARYFDSGLKIGYAPHIELKHLYSGDVGVLRTFIESFVEGEVRYFARAHGASGTISSETPAEWLTRGDWDRDFAAALAKCISRSGIAQPSWLVMPGWWRELLHWRIVAACGIGWPIRKARLRAAYLRVLLFAASMAGSRAQLSDCFEKFIVAYIHSRRLKEISAHLPALQDMPCGQGVVTVRDLGEKRRASGFHFPEIHLSTAMNWSRPAAVVEVRVPPGSSGIAVHCAPIRHALDRLRPMFFINEEPVPADRVSYSGHRAVIALDGAPAGILRLAWFCQPLVAPRDPRRLGLPITGISVEAA